MQLPTLCAAHRVPTHVTSELQLTDWFKTCETYGQTLLVRTNHKRFCLCKYDFSLLDIPGGHHKSAHILSPLDSIGITCSIGVKVKVSMSLTTKHDLTTIIWTAEAGGMTTNETWHVSIMSQPVLLSTCQLGCSKQGRSVKESTGALNSDTHNTTLLSHCCQYLGIYATKISKINFCDL